MNDHPVYIVFDAPFLNTLFGTTVTPEVQKENKWSKMTYKTLNFYQNWQKKIAFHSSPLHLTIFLEPDIFDTDQNECVILLEFQAKWTKIVDFFIDITFCG